MTKIQLKTGRRKTQVSRAKVRKIMSRLFAKTTGIEEKGIAVKTPVYKAAKTANRKTTSRTAA